MASSLKSFSLHISVLLVLVLCLNAAPSLQARRASLSTLMKEGGRRSNVEQLPMGGRSQDEEEEQQQQGRGVPAKLSAAGASAAVHSSPARPMPSYNRFAAPVPLPEFPTLAPPVVWSFPAAPLPSTEAPPPLDMPVLPGHKSPPPPPCHDAPGGRSHARPSPPSPVPVIASEPVISPGFPEPPEVAPEPTAGGLPPPP